MFSIASLKSLFPFIRPYRKWLFFSLFLAIPLSLVQVGPLPILKYFIDDVLVNKNESHLLWYPLGIIGLYAINMCIKFFHNYSLRIVVVNVNQKVREKLYQHLIHLSVDYFTEQKAGVLLSRITADPQNLDAGITAFNSMIREPVTFLAVLIYALYTNWRLAILIFVIAPAMALLFSKTGKYIKRKIANYQEKNGESYSTIQEAIAGIRVIHLFNLENYTIQNFTKQISHITVLLLKISKMESLASPLVELISSFAIAGTIYYGGASVIQGRMTVGDLIAFFTALAVMLGPIRQFGDINSRLHGAAAAMDRLHGAAAAMDRINDFFSWEPKIKDAPNATILRGIHQGIELKNATFSYPDTERAVINNVSFKIPIGKTVALVGQSGSGKSSVVQLLTRIYDLTGGKILVDGHDLKSLKIKEWREKVAVVSQDVFLFHDTIYHNILLGKVTASKEEVYEAARKAFAFDFINQLPQGFDTIVGDRGVKLSGGERQRISIARAFLKDADFLILDEATSNLDNQSEKIVQDTLDTLMKNKTTLVIAHRLSTIRDADHIIVLNQGQIAEEGHFEELMGHAGEFKRLANMAGMAGRVESTS